MRAISERNWLWDRCLIISIHLGWWKGLKLKFMLRDRPWLWFENRLNSSWSLRLKMNYSIILNEFRASRSATLRCFRRIFMSIDNPHQESNSIRNLRIYDLFLWARNEIKNCIRLVIDSLNHWRLFRNLPTFLCRMTRQLKTSEFIIFDWSDAGIAWRFVSSLRFVSKLNFN